MYAAILIYVWPDNAFGANQKFNTYFHATPYDTIIAFYFQTSNVAIFIIYALGLPQQYTHTMNTNTRVWCTEAAPSGKFSHHQKSSSVRTRQKFLTRSQSRAKLRVSVHLELVWRGAAEIERSGH